VLLAVFVETLGGFIDFVARRLYSTILFFVRNLF